MESTAVETGQSTATWNRRAIASAWMIVAVGATLRIGRFCAFRSLWLDELFLTHSILNRGFWNLISQPLDYWQAATPGFLVLEKLSVLVFGPGERALRLVSFVAGLGSLPLFLFVVKRILNARAAIIALVFFATLGPLIYYSSEAKPYGSDVAIALAIALAVLRFVENPSIPRAKWLAGIGIGGVLCSFPAIFVLAGMGLGAIFMLRLAAVKRLAIALSAPAGVFVVEQFLLRHVLYDAEVHRQLVLYWAQRNAFMPLWPIWWPGSALIAICRSPGAMWLDYPGAAFCAFGVGAAIALRKRGGLLLMLAPFPVMLLAAALKQYPMADRLVLFFVPMILIGIGTGLDALCGNFAGIAAAMLILCVTLVPSARLSIAYFFHPPGREETLQTYRWIAEHWQPGDGIYLSHYATASYDFYHQQAGLNCDPSRLWIEPPLDQDSSAVFGDVEKLAGKGRIWVVQVHTDEAGDQQSCTLAALDQIGRRDPDLFHFEPGANTWLYDCGKTIKP
jgi:hypothetical protein